MKRIDRISVLLAIALGQVIKGGNCCGTNSVYEIKKKKVEEKLYALDAWKLRFLYSRTQSQDYRAYLNPEDEELFKQTMKKVAYARRAEMASAIFSGAKTSESPKNNSRHAKRNQQHKKQLRKYNS